MDVLTFFVDKTQREQSTWRGHLVTQAGASPHPLLPQPQASHLSACGSCLPTAVTAVQDRSQQGRPPPSARCDSQHSSKRVIPQGSWLLPGLFSQAGRGS